jgi:hypothetical protein
VIDEFVFGSQHFGEGTVHADALQGAQMSLTTDFGVGAQTFSTFPKVVRVARGLQGDPRNFLDDLPKDAGLVRIGNEILCYDFIGLLHRRDHHRRRAVAASWAPMRARTKSARSSTGSRRVW